MIIIWGLTLPDSNASTNYSFSHPLASLQLGHPNLPLTLLCFSAAMSCQSSEYCKINSNTLCFLPIKWAMRSTKCYHMVIHSFQVNNYLAKGTLVWEVHAYISCFPLYGINGQFCLLSRQDPK